jgi:hypothetical protein
MWSVPRWGEPVVAVLAPGPSLPEDADRIAQAVPAIAVNDAYRRAPSARMLYAADAKWWAVHQDALRFPGDRVSCDPQVKLPQVHVLGQSTDASGFDPDPTKVVTGMNSGYQATHIAMQTGARKVLLVGFDMKGTHFFGRHPEPLRNTSDKTFELFRNRFERLATAAKVRGIDIVNCTPGSALTCFRRSTIEIELEGIRCAA